MLVRSATRAFLPALVVLVLGAAPAVAAPTIDGEFEVPGLQNGNKLVQGPDNNIWVTTGGGGNDVARIKPNGEVKEFAIEAVTPSGITVGPEGRLWVTRNGGLVSFDPIDPEATKQVYNVPLIGGEHSIVLGPDGNLWVATTGKLVKIPPTNVVLGATEVPTGGIAGLAPRDIDVAGSLLVVADFAGARVLNVTTGGVVQETKAKGGVQGVAGNPNGQYAYTQPTTDPREFGLLAPGAAPIITEVPGKDPFGVALGSDGAYWSPEFNSDGLLRMTSTGTVTNLTGFAKNSFPRQIAAGPNNTLWVTLENTKKVGRVSGLEPPITKPPPPPPTGEPRTKIKKGPKGQVVTRGKRAKVRFAFTSPDAGSTFECRLVKVIRKKAKASKVARFKACKSPKVYRLKPGNYRFEVRAVLNGLRDESPATRSFKVVRKARR